MTDQFGNYYQDGCISNDEQIIGTYLHGIFDTQSATETLLKWVSGKTVASTDWNQIRESELERLADVFEEHLDIDEVLKIIT